MIQQIVARRDRGEHSADSARRRPTIMGARRSSAYDREHLRRLFRRTWAVRRIGNGYHECASSRRFSGVSRQLAQLVECPNYGVFRHVAHDFDFADFLWKNEMYCSVASFFVGLQAPEDVAAADFNFWQRTETHDSVNDLTGNGLVYFVHQGTDAGSGN